jgi:peroxiredoxin
MFGLVLVGIALAACSASRSKTEQSRAAKSQNSAGSSSIGTVVGDTAPDFLLTGLDGKQLKLADLHGQPAVLIFWTAWCPVCKEEAPHFNQLAATYEPQGVRVVGINIQDSPARTEGGVREFGIQYRVVRDADASVTHRYKVTGTPTIIFLDRKGIVRYFGNELPADYAARLSELIEQKG